MNVIRLCLLFSIIFLFSNCIGDKMVMVKYQVNNTSQDTLYAHGSISKPFEPQPDTLYVIKPNTKQVIHISQKICWFGDCRMYFKTDTLLDSLKIFRNTLHSKSIEINKKDWKLKKTKAILTIK